MLSAARLVPFLLLLALWGACNSEVPRAAVPSEVEPVEVGQAEVGQAIAAQRENPTPIPKPTTIASPEPTATPSPTTTPKGLPTLKPIGKPFTVEGFESKSTDGIHSAQITVVELLRGETAWELIVAENPFNDPPRLGMEYILAKVRFEYLGGPEGNEYFELDPWHMFYAWSSDGAKYHRSPAVVTPFPALETDLLTGAIHEGWHILQVSKDDSTPVMGFEPGIDNLVLGWSALYPVRESTVSLPPDTTKANNVVDPRTVLNVWSANNADGFIRVYVANESDRPVGRFKLSLKVLVPGRGASREIDWSSIDWIHEGYGCLLPREVREIELLKFRSSEIPLLLPGNVDTFEVRAESVTHLPIDRCKP